MKILLADDNKGIRSLLAFYLKNHLNAEVLQVHNGIEGMKLSESIDFDLIMVDVYMPGCDGIEMVKQIRKHDKKVNIIALSMMDDLVSVKNMLKAGVSAYVLKRGEIDELYQAIEKVLKGETYYSLVIIQSIINGLEYNYKSDEESTLTEGEREVLSHLFAEKTNEQIAAELFINQNTETSQKKDYEEKDDFTKMTRLVNLIIR